MAISKINTGAIHDDAIKTAKIEDDAVTSPKIVDSYTTALQTNPEFSGTEAARMPVGTTAERANPQSGDIRFNSTLSLMEYYDGTIWKSIDSPPLVSSVSPDNFDTAGDTITITGSNFQSGATVKIIANDGSEFVASTVTFTNSTTLTFDITADMVADDDDPYDVQVTNVSGLSATLADALDFAPEPVFATSAGTYNIYDSLRGSYSLDASATSTESDATLSYAVTSGSLPAGASINSSTGAITGFSAVGSDTASTFTVTATATDGDSNTTTNTRSWTLNVKAPVITSYTSSSGSFSVPTGLTTVNVLVVAGGGGGTLNVAGGGAGGLIYRPAFPVTPQGSISYSVGNGGGRGVNGQDSTFGSLTSKGGGKGAGENSTNASPGGSGGGASDGSPGSTGGTGIQPQQPGDSGSPYGFGNPGGNEGNPANQGGGGGGAAEAGYPGDTQSGGSASGGRGGHGRQYDISGSQTYYSGGGGGAGASTGSPGGQGGGGDGKHTSQGQASPGQANRGGGGGGGYATQGGTGGSGLVIVSY